MKYTQIKENINLDQLKQLFLIDRKPKEIIARELNLSLTTLNKLLVDFNLSRDKLEIKPNNKAFNKHLIDVDKNLLYRLYIEENQPYEVVRKYFNLSGWTFDKILKYYNFSKPKVKKNKLIFQTKLNKYGPENFNNWQKGHATRVKNSGSLEESYKTALIKQQQTCLDKYGQKCLLNSSAISSHRKKKDSKPNKIFASLLDRYNISYQQEFVIDLKSYDFKVDDTLIEINPTITHNINYCPYSDKALDKNYHYNKSKLAKDNNLRCIHVWDWDNLDKIINIICEKSILYARKCDIKVLDKHIAEEFLNKYHLQNSCKGQKICLGLYFNSELVEVMTFGKPRYNKKYEYELLRLCSHPKYRIVGGSERLYSFFTREYRPKSIISYCDNAKFNGDVYKRLGLKYSHSSLPTKHWYNMRTKTHITDNLLRQHGFDHLFGDTYGCFGKGSDNETLMLSHGFLEVYDCGQSVFISDNIA